MPDVQKVDLKPILQSVLLPWLETRFSLEATIEGITPEFANWLDTTPSDFSFDHLRQPALQAGWKWEKVTFDEVFDGSFLFYLPEESDVELITRQSALVKVNHSEFEMIYLAEHQYWAPLIIDKVNASDVLAFYHAANFAPHYHQWFIALAEQNDIVALYSCHSSGDWMIVGISHVPVGQHTLLLQTVNSMIISIPWYGWIDAARNTRGKE